MSNIPVNSRSARGIRVALKQMFDVEFELIRHEPKNRQSCQHRTCGAACGCALGIFAEPAGDTRWNLAIRGLDTPSGMVDAVGEVNALDHASVIRMAVTACDLADRERTIDGLNEELGYFIEQVSGDLEEACWFRRMAEEVAACRADEPIEQLCAKILPQLRNLLYARAVLVLSDDNTIPAPLSVIGVDAEADGPWAATAMALIESCRGESDQRALVQNAGFSTGLDVRLPAGIDAFVLVRIGDSSQQFGWLVAIGRTDSQGDAGQSRRSESEFGTHEATLMESAAVLLATHAANCELFAEQERTLVGVVKAMVNALDARDPYTRGHSHRVARIARRLAEEIGLTEEETEDLYLTGLLHDIGKIGVPDHVLLKNGPLTREERRQIELHTVIGHAILEPVRQLKKVLPGVLHHHERLDGTGYPGQLAGQDIPLAGRILAVADAFDAMTTCRPYRKAMPVVEAVQILLEGVCTHWDEVIVDAFFRCLSDIRRIYEDEDHQDVREQNSGLQYGRFEDVCHSGVADLAKLSGVEA